MANTTVRHINRDHIIITPGKGYSVTVFKLGGNGGDLEALVSADDGSETIRLLVAGPRADQAMVISTDDEGVVSITTKPKPEDEK
jgi:hypothetical protein